MFGLITSIKADTNRLKWPLKASFHTCFSISVSLALGRHAHFIQSALIFLDTEPRFWSDHRGLLTSVSMSHFRGSQTCSSCKATQEFTEPRGFLPRKMGSFITREPHFWLMTGAKETLHPQTWSPNLTLQFAFHSPVHTHSHTNFSKLKDTLTFGQKEELNN